jgi:hypothetical protein
VDVTVGGRPVGKGVGCVVLAGFLVVWLAVGAVVLRLGGTALHRVIEGAIQRAGDTGPPRPRQR